MPYIAKEHMNINGAQIKKGQKVFKSRIRGGWDADARLQHTRSRQTTFATVLWAAWEDKFEMVKE